MLDKTGSYCKYKMVLVHEFGFWSVISFITAVDLSNRRAVVPPCCGAQIVKQSDRWLLKQVLFWHQLSTRGNVGFSVLTEDT